MKKYTPLVLRLIVSIILIQTLRFKFTTHPDSVYIFTKIGLEPIGRISIGIVELIASILLLIPKTAWAGSLIALVVIGGAIMMHLTQLGIAVNNDGGTLFITAVITFLLSAIILVIYRKNIPFINKYL
ncbi:DoxX family membrane protein [Gaetbulibacter sp. M235]|uniref:DoxX family membrane protein n=1 Tax=Gaetbulibacter sp. M235 TaxID=3126510 RepID=UPI00374E7629